MLDALTAVMLVVWLIHNFNAGEQIYSTGKVDGRVAYGLAGWLAGSSGCSCCIKEEVAVLESELERLLNSAHNVGIISIKTGIGRTQYIY